MKKAALILLLVCPFILGQDLAKSADRKADEKKSAVAAVLDLTTEEAQQIKEITTQRTERKKEQDAAGQAIALAKTDEDAVKSTLRYQLASERLAVLQLAEALTILNAKVRVGCLDCKYEGGTLVKPAPAK